MLDKNGELNFKFVKSEKNVLKVEVQSRHVSRTIRSLLRYIPNSTGISGVTHYACECVNGLRTIGCYCHIAAIIYYLFHAKYLAKILKPAEILSDLFKKTNNIPVIAIVKKIK